MSATPRERLCPKCGSEMEVGFLLDNAHVNYFPAIWVEGLPERSFLRTVKVKGKLKCAVEAYRCVKCGFLECYAPYEWLGWPQA